LCLLGRVRAACFCLNTFVIPCGLFDSLLVYSELRIEHSRIYTIRHCISTSTPAMRQQPYFAHVAYMHEYTYTSQAAFMNLRSIGHPCSCTSLCSDLCWSPTNMMSHFCVWGDSCERVNSNTAFCEVK